jgi:hemin uptake protein HemP
MSQSTHHAEEQLHPDARHQRPDACPTQQPAQASLACVISSEALLCGQPSVNITHQGATYRLQKTRQGKLILTK